MACTLYSLPMTAWAATDAGFRIWGKAWTDMLDLMGFQQLYSNIDWTTVLLPTTANTVAGKRVYKFNDNLSSTREIYFSVSFGRGSTTTAGQGLMLTVSAGTSYDGNGNVSNYLLTNYFTQILNVPDGGDIFGVKSHLGFLIFTNLNAGTALQAGFGLERLAENGVATPDGLVSMVSGNNTNNYSTTNQGSASFRVANYAGGQVFGAVGGENVGTGSGVLRNFQAIPYTSDPSYAGKAPAITIDTFGKYDPCYHYIVASGVMYSPATEFFAVINGVEGTYRLPYTGFNADYSSTSSPYKLALKVA